MRYNVMVANRAKWFSITPIFFNVIRIAIAISAFYYLYSHELFPQWINYIYYAVKLYVALEVIIGSARSIMMPLLALAAGGVCFLAAQTYMIDFVTMANAWQLMLLAAVGFLISLLL